MSWSTGRMRSDSTPTLSMISRLMRMSPSVWDISGVFLRVQFRNMARRPEKSQGCSSHHCCWTSLSMVQSSRLSVVRPQVVMPAPGLPVGQAAGRGLDAGARLAGDEGGGVPEGADDGGTAGHRHELAGGLHLGPHGPC